MTQLAAASSSAGAAELTPASGQTDGAEADSGQAPGALTGQSGQSMPHASQGTSSHQPSSSSQQPDAPSIKSDRGLVAVHKQNGQLQVWACYCSMLSHACSCVYLEVLPLATIVSCAASLHT